MLVYQLNKSKNKQVVNYLQSTNLELKYMVIVKDRHPSKIISRQSKTKRVNPQSTFPFISLSNFNTTSLHILRSVKSASCLDSSACSAPASFTAARFSHSRLLVFFSATLDSAPYRPVRSASGQADFHVVLPCLLSVVILY